MLWLRLGMVEGFDSQPVLSMFNPNITEDSSVNPACLLRKPVEIPDRLAVVSSSLWPRFAAALPCHRHPPLATAQFMTRPGPVKCLEAAGVRIQCPWKIEVTRKSQEFLAYLVAKSEGSVEP